MSRRMSVAEHQLAGTNLNRVLKRAPTKPEARFESGVPEMPEALTPPERAVWNRVAAILEAREVLTPGDGLLLEKYAILYCRWQSERALLDAEGCVVDKLTSRGKDHYGVTIKAKNPRLAVVQSCERALLQLDMQLCLTVRTRNSGDQTKTAVDAVAELLAELDGGVQ